MKYRNLLRSVVFLLVLAIAVLSIQVVFSNGMQQQNYDMLRGFDLEKKGRLDGVYIGSSNVHYFWQPLMGWSDHGIAVWNYATSSMAAATVKYYLMQAHKRQPDALYIISINTFKYLTSEVNEPKRLHYSLDYFPWSINRLKATHDLVNRSPDKGLAALEYYLPIIRFHSRWSKLETWELGGPDNSYKATRSSGDFLTHSIVMPKDFSVTDAREPLSDDMATLIGELLDYCDANRVNALFVKCPQNLSAEEQGRLNTILDIAAERGYPGLDLMQGLDETGIDLRMDYVDDKHTNVHGSLKYSKVLGDYLVENYHFEDKRGRADWSDWDSAALKYTGQISGVTLPIEREHAPRTLTEVPELRTPRVDGQSIMVRWRAADAVDGYEIFRKPDASGKAAWQSVGRVGPEDLEWLDEGLSPNTKYTYTVVPYCEENGETLYGSFKFKGVSARTEK